VNILFITNLYPPHHLGGYELRCHDVVTKLEKRGHRVTMLTSTYGLERPVVENSVHRVLALESDTHHYQPASLLRLRKDNRRNLGYLRQALADFQPDVIFIWGMWNLSKLIAQGAERQVGNKVVYSIADMWPTHTDAHTAYWQTPARRWFMRLPKRILATLIRPYLRLEGLPATLRLENVICVSKALRDNLVSAGVPVHNARVIYSGIVLDDFLSSTRDRTWRDGKLSLLYVGRLVKEKGAHTAILALAELANQRNLNNLDLTLLGWGPPDYVSHLRALANDNGLGEHITFLDPIPRAEMPGLLSRFHVLLFPSIWEEPFSRTLLEAMASGLAVVGTTTGGSKEVVVDGENALTFTPGDAHDLARQIERLARDPALRKRLALAGARTVRERFDIERMVDQIEAYLLEVAGRG
jgi:glycosyltransferase involved in cell wall biosynthesis